MIDLNLDIDEAAALFAATVMTLAVNNAAIAKGTKQLSHIQVNATEKAQKKLIELVPDLAVLTQETQDDNASEV